MMMMMMMMMMIWMTRTDEHHAPSITMIRSRYHVTCVALKHFKCEQYLTFSPSILLFFKHFGCKFKELNHIKELRTPYFKIKTSLGLIFPVLDCPSLILQNCSYTCLNKISNFFSLGSIIKVTTAILKPNHCFSPPKFFKFKFLPLVKDYPGEYYILYCLIDMYC